jgi:hypothetical protein
MMHLAIKQSLVAQVLKQAAGQNIALILFHQLLQMIVRCPYSEI